jgi:small GTP-binding protein
MGGGFAKFFNCVPGAPVDRENRILILGLNTSGKTTLLYRLKINQVVSMPTTGYNVETIEYKGEKFRVFDVGGHKEQLENWTNFYRGTIGIIFVFDSANTDRIPEVKSILHSTFKDEALKGIPVLILGNKQDMESAIKLQGEITKKLELHLLEGRSWYLKVGSALQGEGMEEILDFMHSCTLE